MRQRKTNLGWWEDRWMDGWNEVIGKEGLGRSK